LTNGKDRVIALKSQFGGDFLSKVRMSAVWPGPGAAVELDMLMRLQRASWVGEIPDPEDRALMLGSVALWAREATDDPGLHAVPRNGGWIAVPTHMAPPAVAEPTEVGAYIRAVEYYNKLQEMKRLRRQRLTAECYPLMQRFLQGLVLRCPSLVFSTALDVNDNVLMVEYDVFLRYAVVSYTPSTGTVSVTLAREDLGGPQSLDLGVGPKADQPDYIEAEWSGVTPEQGVGRLIEFFAELGMLAELQEAQSAQGEGDV
jgi:hypothetical protein